MNSQDAVTKVCWMDHNNTMQTSWVKGPVTWSRDDNGRWTWDGEVTSEPTEETTK